tara:strand:+ start:772 stop:1557 length:786 start_codon:yes stop_codon:yes gene_type:complete
LARPRSSLDSFLAPWKMPPPMPALRLRLSAVEPAAAPAAPGAAAFEEKSLLFLPEADLDGKLFGLVMVGASEPVDLWPRAASPRRSSRLRREVAGEVFCRTTCLMRRLEMRASGGPLEVFVTVSRLLEAWRPGSVPLEPQEPGWLPPISIGAVLPDEGPDTGTEQPMSSQVSVHAEWPSSVDLRLASCASICACRSRSACSSLVSLDADRMGDLMLSLLARGAGSLPEVVRGAADVSSTASSSGCFVGVERSMIKRGPGVC